MKEFYTGLSKDKKIKSKVTVWCLRKKWMEGWMNEWMNGWINEWMEGWMNEWMNEWMDKWMDG